MTAQNDGHRLNHSAAQMLRIFERGDHDHVAAQAGSLAAELVARAAARDGGGSSATLQYSLSRRVPLAGRELADFYEAAERQVRVTLWRLNWRYLP